MTFSFSIPTVRRSGRPLQLLLQRLLDTGTFDDPRVIGFHLSYGRGPNDNAVHALRHAAADDPTWVIHLEDDVDIVDDFLGSVDRWLTDVALPDIRLYPLGCAVRRAMRAARAAGQHTWEYPLREFYGACGFAMRPADARDFCDRHDSQPAWMMPWNGIDVNLKRWHERRVPTQTVLLTPVPCLIDHLGAVSSLSTDPKHFTGRYDGFVGRHGRYPHVDTAR